MKKATNIVTETIGLSSSATRGDTLGLMQYNNIMEEIKQLSKTVDNIKEDLDRDRVDIGDTKIELVKLAAVVEGLRKEVTAQGEKLKGRMADIIEPAMEHVDLLTDAINTKKKVVINYKSIFPSNWFRKGVK